MREPLNAWDNTVRQWLPMGESLVLPVAVQTDRIIGLNLRWVPQGVEARTRRDIRNTALRCEDSGDGGCVLAEAINDNVTAVGVLLVRRRCIVRIYTAKL